METEINILHYPDGRFCLTVMDADEATYALFDERELQGGGYTWECIVQSLVEMRLPDALPRLHFGAEADNMHVDSDDRQLLEQVAALVQAAIADRELLVAAMEHAGENLE